jgi:predicted flap endonuclease-1-like 5' DNA nuclease
MARIIDVEGIGPFYAQKMIDAGIKTTGKLLKEGATPQGRRMIAAKTDIDETLILEWINHADLFRIKGVGEEYADLLEEAGVDTIPELAQRNPENLHASLVQVNEEKKLVRQLPAMRQVRDWVQQARALPRVIQY